MKSNQLELQYILDTIFIEKLAEDLAADYAINKNAGFISDTFSGLFSGVASSITDFAKRNLSSDADGGIVGGILNIIISGAIFSFSPLLGLIYTAASSILGIDLRDIAIGIINKIAPSLRNGTVTESAVNQAAIEEANKRSTAGYMPISEILKHAGVTKVAGVSIGSIFSMIGKGKATSLVVGIVGWLLRTLLIGGGLIVAGGAAARAVGFNPEENREKSQSMIQQFVNPIPYKASGRGEKVFKNDNNNFWIVPLINNDIDYTLVAWAIDVYPEVQKYKNEIESLQKFKDVSGAMKEMLEPPIKDKVVMPSQFTSRKQVVDSFIKDLPKMIKE